MWAVRDRQFEFGLRQLEFGLRPAPALFAAVLPSGPPDLIPVARCRCLFSVSTQTKLSLIVSAPEKSNDAYIRQGLSNHHGQSCTSVSRCKSWDFAVSACRAFSALWMSRTKAVVEMGARYSFITFHDLESEPDLLFQIGLLAVVLSSCHQLVSALGSASCCEPLPFRPFQAPPVLLRFCHQAQQLLCFVLHKVDHGLNKGSINLFPSS